MRKYGLRTLLFAPTWYVGDSQFGEMGGCFSSYSSVEFLDKTYGWEPVIDFASGGKSHEEVFGLSERSVYDAWLASLPR